MSNKTWHSLESIYTVYPILIRLSTRLELHFRSVQQMKGSVPQCQFPKSSVPFISSSSKTSSKQLRKKCAVSVHPHHSRHSIGAEEVDIPAAVTKCHLHSLHHGFPFSFFSRCRTSSGNWSRRQSCWGWRWSRPGWIRQCMVTELTHYRRYQHQCPQIRTAKVKERRSNFTHKWTTLPSTGIFFMIYRWHFC